MRLIKLFWAGSESQSVRSLEEKWESWAIRLLSRYFGAFCPVAEPAMVDTRNLRPFWKFWGYSVSEQTQSATLEYLQEQHCQQKKPTYRPLGLVHPTTTPPQNRSFWPVLLDTR